MHSGSYHVQFILDLGEYVAHDGRQTGVDGVENTLCSISTDITASADGASLVDLDEVCMLKESSALNCG